jgi:acyl-coenzyme A thioesterase PaaI-like protein
MSRRARTGRIRRQARPQRLHPFGAVHGGYAATLLDSACGIATHSTLGPGRGPETSSQPRSAWTHEVDLRPFKEPF